MRKVSINAQVTAVISLIETISNIIYILLLWITVRASYLIIVQTMILYMVVIPYTFLMNTSDNKNRVIEYGWRTVFLNLLGSGNNRRISPLEASKKNLHNPQKTDKLKTISGGDVQGRLYTTEFSTNITSEDIGGYASTIYSTLDDEATTSNGNKSTNPKNPASVTLDVKNLPTHLIYQNTAKDFITQMIYHINDREQYIKYFKCLIAYEEGKKNGNVPSERELQSEFGLQYMPETTMQTKKHKGKGKRSICQNTASGSKTHCDVLYNVRKMDTRFQRKDVPNKKNRELRNLLKRILDNIDCSNTKDTLYHNLVEELIVMEERFVE